MNPIDAQANPHIVKIDVAAVGDGVQQAHRTVARRVPAMDQPAQHHGFAGAAELGVFGDDALSQGSCRNQNLKNGAGGKGTLDHLVLQRLVRIFDQLPPLGRRQLVDEQVGVELRFTDQAIQFAGPDIHGNQSALLPLHQLLGPALQLRVDG